MKTRLYTRKRALISSVAMLLVAMIALGTATFAWFTSDPTAKATGLKMKTTAATGLVIMTESRQTRSQSLGTGTAYDKERTEWRHADFLNYVYNEGTSSAGTSTDSVSLSPTSFDLSTADTLGTPVKVVAGDDSSYAAQSGAVVTEATGAMASGDFYQEKIYCKVTGTEDSATMKATSLRITQGANTKLKSTARVAIEYTTAAGVNKLIGVYALDASKQHGYLVDFDATDTVTNYYDALPSGVTSGDTNNVVSAETPAENPFKLNTAVSDTVIGTVGKTGNDYITVTVYVDGQDDNCYTNNFDLADIISSIELNLTVA